ncbi:MAG: MerR family DNA-binding protein [Deltaproteobacteria bacterium]|nr:MerR family DNA-binding protein [Deltaproteobacteria bacterium]
MKTGTTLSIGELASEAGVGVETLRFYERKGLVPEPSRSLSGYRQYPAQTIRRVRFIRRAKQLGFTLREIRELLEIRVDPDRSCADVRTLANAKLENVRRKMADLARIEGALTELAQACRGRGPTSQCPILDAMDTETK